MPAELARKVLAFYGICRFVTVRPMSNFGEEE